MTIDRTKTRAHSTVHLDVAGTLGGGRGLRFDDDDRLGVPVTGLGDAIGVWLCGTPDEFEAFAVELLAVARRTDRETRPASVEATIAEPRPRVRFVADRWEYVDGSGRVLTADECEALGLDSTGRLLAKWWDATAVQP